MSYRHIKPRLSADAVARAGGSSIMAVLQGLDLKLVQRGPHELAGDCPRCRGVDRLSINMMAGSWACLGACKAEGNSGISLLQHARGFFK
jgi:hypothetical protein